MKNVFIWTLALVLCAGLFIVQRPDLLRPPGPAPTPAPLPSPPPAGGELFRAIFSRSSSKDAARGHALTLAAIAEGAKEVLAYDWKQPTPLVASGFQVAIIRKFTREGALDGWSFLSLYPELGPTLDTFFEQRVGREPGKLTTSDRERWLAAFSDLYVACNWAGENL